jgi:hypothetical protein
LFDIYLSDLTKSSVVVEDKALKTKKEHRRLLRKSLLQKTAKRPSFGEYLLKMPKVGSDEVFNRTPDAGRKEPAICR